MAIDKTSVSLVNLDGLQILIGGCNGKDALGQFLDEPIGRVAVRTLETSASREQYSYASQKPKPNLHRQYLPKAPAISSDIPPRTWSLPETG